MNLADQIESVARAATAEVAAASREFSRVQHDLARRLDEVRTTATGDAARLRTELQEQADAVDALPGILLPADMAQGSPHLPPPSA